MENEGEISGVSSSAYKDTHGIGSGPPPHDLISPELPPQGLHPQIQSHWGLGLEQEFGENGGYNLVIAARVYFKLVLKVLLEQYDAFLSYLCTFYVIRFCSVWEGSSVSSDFHDRNPHA